MKHIFLLVCLFAGSVSLLADDYNYLVLTQNDNTESGTVLRKTRRITFDGDAIVVTATDGKVSLPLSALRQISFTEAAPVGIRSVGGTWAPQRIVIYNTSGMIVRQIDSTDARQEVVNLYLNALPAGVYIIKEGTQTRKLLKR
ncbi:MAG: T9SS type A sorting domain-containing protein [Bacteroidaceae bacterium]|nr:T9SS type A sorting domain-containing protein [Bacteroidaceae bacterium]